MKCLECGDELDIHKRDCSSKAKTPKENIAVGVDMWCNDPRGRNRTLCQYLQQCLGITEEEYLDYLKGE